MRASYLQEAEDVWSYYTANSAACVFLDAGSPRTEIFLDCYLASRPRYVRPSRGLVNAAIRLHGGLTRRLDRADRGRRS
jgi:hypothetical protein